MIELDIVVHDLQWKRWLADAAAGHSQLRLRWRDGQAATQDMGQARAAMLQIGAPSDALVQRYVALNVPVILLAAKDHNHSRVYDAIQAGARYLINIDDQEPDLPAALERALRLLQGDARREEAANVGATKESPVQPVQAQRRAKPPPIVAIGASAGGPKALAQVLGDLPADLHAAIVVLVHVEPGQDPDLREFLKARCKLPLVPAANGTTLEPGRVFLGVAGQHLQFTGHGELTLTQRQEGELFCPSIDRLFSSLARLPQGGVAALLTGMGSDGARGLLALRQAGWATIAQDAESSAVYGMPREAARLGAASALVPLKNVASTLVSRLALLFPDWQATSPSSPGFRSSLLGPLSKS